MGKQRSFRTTITVPLDLKKRMDAVKETLNWSAIACRAFEAKLAEIATRKVEKNMENVIQRLRGSKIRTDDQHFKDGEKAGQEWAKNQADADELKRLADWDWDRIIEEDMDDSEGAAVTIYRRMHPDDRNLRAAHAFWSDLFGREFMTIIEDAMFMKGFAAGAVEIWRNVKDEL